MRHAANNSSTPSPSFRVTNKREPLVLTDQSCHRGEARCCGLTLYPQHIYWFSSESGYTDDNYDDDDNAGRHSTTARATYANHNLASYRVQSNCLSSKDNCPSNWYTYSSSKQSVRVRIARIRCIDVSDCYRRPYVAWSVCLRVCLCCSRGNYSTKMWKNHHRGTEDNCVKNCVQKYAQFSRTSTAFLVACSHTDETTFTF